MLWLAASIRGLGGPGPRVFGLGGTLICDVALALGHGGVKDVLQRAAHPVRREPQLVAEAADDQLAPGGEGTDGQAGHPRQGRIVEAPVDPQAGAPELGSPELMLDSKPAVKSLSFTQATPYISVNPGTHTLGAMRPGDSTPLVPGAHMSLVSGRAYSAIVLGSRGQRVRVVTVTDSGAPLTRHASASSPAKRASAGGPTSVMVRPGDSLWSIAKDLLPAGASASAIDHRVVQIWDRNRGRIGTGDPSLIFAGQRLLLS